MAMALVEVLAGQPAAVKSMTTLRASGELCAAPCAYRMTIPPSG